ncbi:hypothetical protein F4779DRAFT_641986 [Xylariaceae sp. FL0662B]|nr:hypothetical protein F4779DRAFT_641986 [Xylariaceae sp. FL0662B]
MRYSLHLLLAYATLATAAPPYRDALDELAGRGILEEVDFSDVVERADAGQFRGKVPGCSKDEDPSYVIPKTSKYKIDRGVKVPKQGKDDACTSGHHDDHCWNEYWMVESEVEFNNWENTGSAIDCKGTSDCRAADINITQSCTTNTHSKSKAGEVKLELAFEGTVPLRDGRVKAGVGGGPKIEKSKSKGTTMCISNQSSNICVWDDQKCHQVWSAQRNLRVYGYTTRVCTGKTKKKVQQQTKNGKGHWVRGQSDFSILLPINKLVGCGALCKDQSYKEPKPRSEGKKPFSVEGW